jgi:hypothetical protein
MVEGAPLAAGRNDADNNRVEVFQDFNSGNAKSRESDCRKPLIANGISSGVVATSMRFAIYLDRQARFETGKIQSIAELRVLPPELEIPRRFAQRLPGQHLG